jgi:hypothetical protein
MVVVDVSVVVEVSPANPSVATRQNELKSQTVGEVDCHTNGYCVDVEDDD